MQGRKDYYQVLGVRRNATTRAIKNAFLKLTRQMEGEDRALDRLADLTAAYETLSDHEQRRRYDETLRVVDPGTGVSWSFLKNTDGRELKRPVEPGSLSAEVFLTAAEARSGGIVTLEIPVPTTCSECYGTGGAALNCFSCDGEGVTHHRMPVPLRVPAGARTGMVFQVHLDDPLVSTLFLTVHTRFV
jgi:molecular chaperone DnaJ